MRPVSLLAAATLLAGSLASPAGAGSRFKTLGTDPSGDGPPALDVTYLKVGPGGVLTADGRKEGLEIRIGIDKMLPEMGGFPDLPGIEWVFEVNKRVFIAEAVAGRTPRFFLFELIDGEFNQLESPAGTYDAADGFVRIAVPLEWIGAEPGDVIKGTTYEGGSEGDVDAHIHVGPQTHFPDWMKTTKSYVVR
ncbi:MAG: hypothetical protein ACRDJ5_07115 [Actinomycetota bacterium]